MIVLLSLVVSTNAGPSALRQAHHAAPLDRALADALRDAGTPGVSAAVIFADGSRWTGTAGFADAQTRRRVTTGTPFAIASVTKTFVAALALQLAHEGRFGLDDPVSRWLPELVNGDRITMRQLLGHTSGLEEGPPPRAPFHRWSPAQVLAQGQTFVCDPGTCFRYSDMGYVAAGAVLESVTGESLTSLLRARIFRPLGMHTTWLQGFERQRGRVAVHVPDADDDSGIEPSTEFATRTGAAGALATTASDLAEWGEALFAGRLLDPSVPDAMLDFDASARLPCPAADRCPEEYGLGMEAQLVGGWLTWMHSGSTGSLLAHFPGQHVTIAVLTNAEPRSGAGAFPVLGALVASMPELRAEADVFGVNRDGTARRRITRSAGAEGEPAISPDGVQLAFATERERGSEIAVSDLDGSHVRLLTHNRAQDTLPAWSPDGARIAFVSERDGDWEIYVMDAGGGHQTRLTSEPGQDWAPAWSPDGTLIAYDHRAGSTLAVRVMNPDGTSVRTIAQAISPGRFAAYSSWSPDGRRLAFAGSAGGDADIQVVGVDGSSLTTITDDHVPEFDPAWGPDGALAFVRLGDVYIVVPGVDDTPRRVTATYGAEFRPAWFPDGSALVFAGISGGR